MKRTIIVLFIFAIISIVLYKVFRDNLPPRTPLKMARKISGLNITNDFRLVSSVEEWNDFNGDGSFRAEFEVRDSQLASLIEECKLINYQKLPIKNPPRELDGALFLKSMEGLYKIRIHDELVTAFDLVVLDLKTKKLIVYVFVS